MQIALSIDLSVQQSTAQGFRRDTHLCASATIASELHDLFQAPTLVGLDYEFGTKSVILDTRPGRNEYSLLQMFVSLYIHLTDSLRAR